MPTITTVMLSTQVHATHIQQFHANQTWGPFEAYLLNLFHNRLAAVQVTSIHLNIDPSRSPGPLQMNFTITSNHDLTGPQARTVISSP